MRVINNSTIPRSERVLGCAVRCGYSGRAKSWGAARDHAQSKFRNTKVRKFNELLLLLNKFQDPRAPVIKSDLHN